MWDSKRDTDVKNNLLDSVGEGEGGMIWKNNAERCVLPYVKYLTSASLIHETGSQSWYTSTTKRDGMGKELGWFQMGDTCTPVADSCQCMLKTTTIL